MYSMTINELYNLLSNHHLLQETPDNEKWQHMLKKSADITFTYLSYDSRDLKEQTLFFCKGLNFKAELLEAAVEDGVTHYLSEVSYDVAAQGILVTDIREAMAIVAQAFYQQPQDKLYKIGITGTKGKTTAAYFIKKVLDEAFNQKVALFSSEETTLDGKTFYASKLTTPEALDLYRQMALAVASGTTHLVMEVSSQAYKTKRVFGLTFETGIFLNISPDHISPIEHATFEEYFACKCQLLSNSKQMVINHDSDHFDTLEEICQKEQVPYYTFGQKTGTYRIQSLDNPRCFHLEATQDELDANGDYQLALFGTFNHDNAAATILTTRLAGVAKEIIQESLPQSHVPGRMNLLEKTNGAYIFIDYAHNYLSIKAIGAFAKELRPKGRVIIVTGSAGDKALSRRPDIGKALSECADIAILTSDDPGFEDAAAIIEEISHAITNPQLSVQIELDRAKAVTTAVEMAQADDTVILAGKGTEQMMKVRGVQEPYEGDFHITQRLIQANA